MTVLDFKTWIAHRGEQAFDEFIDENPDFDGDEFEWMEETYEAYLGDCIDISYDEYKDRLLFEDN